MKIEEMNREQLAELHMMRVAVGLPHEGIAGFMQQYEPYKEFLYDLEPDELDVHNELWKNDRGISYVLRHRSRAALGAALGDWLHDMVGSCPET